MKKIRVRSNRKAHGKYPIATIISYGPDDKTCTKVVATIIKSEHDEEPSAMKKWFGENVDKDKKTMQEIADFIKENGIGVKDVIITDAPMGCVHEEGIDFPVGEDCPDCPFWKGKQGSKSGIKAASGYLPGKPSLSRELLKKRKQDFS
jgi:hypothetical protein